MKKIILLLCVTCALKISFAQSQVEGVLTYQNVYDDNLGTGTVTTTIYESKGKARIESTNAQTKSAIDAPSTKDQNIILFDFTTQKETQLNAKMNTAITTGFTVVMMEQRMQATIGTDYIVQNIGTEQVGTYNCTHFTITTTSSKYKNIPPAKKDVWITNDLGSGNIFYVGSYLYYPLGSSVAQKLTAAGAVGVVVKWQVMDPISKKPLVCNLISYQPKKIPAATFLPPSNYTAIQR
ncbi:MAG TPA: DUF4412 domain-containing protein [Puia sp.]|jgi:hypothetical protein|nr:DUF4412 domain-containing protein [Puia sp.]